MRITDSLGRTLTLPTPPRRIVCLVPSWTESLFSLGAGDRVVGVTEYCVHPADGVAAKQRVGGTKNADVAAIADLRPDLVIANKEENRRRHVVELAARGLPVLVTDARTVAGALAELALIGRVIDAAVEADNVVVATRAALGRAAARAAERATAAAALIWKKPFMAVGADTFAHDLLVCAGAANPFAVDRWQGARYPRISADDLCAAAPDVLLLPTEPYAFAEPDRRELMALDCPAARSGRIHIVEGELLSWYGPRLPRALDLFSALLHP